MLGRFDEAAATLQQALGFNAANAWIWVEPGNVRYDQGDTAGALAHHSATLAAEAAALLERHPQNFAALNVQARALLSEGKASEADAAMAIDPALSRTNARKLSELGFLPLSNAPAGVLTALKRCIDVKQAACVFPPE